LLATPSSRGSFPTGQNSGITKLAKTKTAHLLVAKCLKRLSLSW
jgi:hypothetical protein